jgi:hypothetical protein
MRCGRPAAEAKPTEAGQPDVWIERYAECLEWISMEPMGGRRTGGVCVKVKQTCGMKRKSHAICLAGNPESHPSMSLHVGT